MNEIYAHFFILAAILFSSCSITESQNNQEISSLSYTTSLVLSKRAIRYAINNESYSLESLFDSGINLKLLNWITSEAHEIAQSSEYPKNENIRVTTSKTTPLFGVKTQKIFIFPFKNNNNVRKINITVSNNQITSFTITVIETNKSFKLF